MSQNLPAGYQMVTDVRAAPRPPCIAWPPSCGDCTHHLACSPTCATAWKWTTILCQHDDGPEQLDAASGRDGGPDACGATAAICHFPWARPR